MSEPKTYWPPVQNYEREVTEVGPYRIDVSSEYKWETRFAWLPVKTIDCGRIWLRKYHMFLEHDWTGGLMGGYAWLIRAQVCYRSSVHIKQYPKSYGKG